MVIGNFGEVLVLDWGTAASPQFQEATDGERPAGLIGTPAYMSPEQARREPADQRSDVYALGATLFHLLTLRYPLWLDDPELFWAGKRRGEVQPLTPSEVAALPATLIEIVMRALAADPGDRFPSVSAMQHAIREWQAHAESLQLTAHAQAALAGAEHTPGYAAFNDAASSYRLALQMWPGNLEAAQGLRETLRQHALRSLQVGDFGLAKVLAEEARDTALIERATVKRRRTRLLRIAAFILVMLVCALTGRIAIDWWQKFATWEVVLDRDFTGTSLAADQSMQGFELTHEDVFQVVPPPKRNLSGVTFPASYTWWIEPLQVRGDVRIEIDMEWNDRVDAVEVFFNSHREQPPSWWMSPAGYSCQFAGWNGRVSYLSTNDQAQMPVTADGKLIPFALHHPYHLVVQRLDDRLSMSVNGNEIITRQEALPLIGTGFERVALRMWAETLIRRVRILRRAIPENASPLIAGDALVSDGRFASAARIYEEIARDRPGTVLARRALAKACVALVHLGSEHSTHRSQLRAQLVEGTPESDTTWLAEALGAWRDDRGQDAFDALDHIADPQSRGALALLGLEHRPLAPEIGDQLLRRIATVQGIARLDLRHLGLRDISPLRGLHLQSIDLQDNPVADLSSLAGMPLEDVILSTTQVADLSPLRGAPIKRLSLKDTPVTDLTPLHGMPIASLDLFSVHVTDLSPLAGMPLATLDISDSPIVDLSALQGLPLVQLSAGGSQITSLRGLAGMPLEVLDISSCQVSSLEELRGMPLKRVSFFGNPVLDISPLRGLPLQWLDLAATRVTQLDALAGMPLEHLNLTGAPVQDLSPLARLPLITLEITDTRVTSLAPLSVSKLQLVSIDRTGVSDLSPLAQAPLDYLSAVGAPLTHIGIFETHPPRHFLIDAPQVKSAIDALITRFDHDPTRRRQAQELRVLAAVRDGNREDARALATVFDGKRYLHVPAQMTFAQARAACQRLGGELIMPHSPAVQQLAKSMLDTNALCWIGLMGFNHHDHWLNGNAVGWSHYRSFNHGKVPRTYVIQMNLDDASWSPTAIDTYATWIIQWDNL